jgi:hypothetical protein
LGELEQVLVNSFGMEAGLAEDLARFQRFSLKSLNSEPLEDARFENDWMWICNLGEKGIGLETKLFARDGYAFRDWADYAREVVWYGRKGSSMKRKLEYSSCA